MATCLSLQTWWASERFPNPGKSQVCGSYHPWHGAGHAGGSEGICHLHLLQAST